MIRKTHRILEIYTQLTNGAVVNKSAAAMMFGVDERSIQRDVDDIRAFLENSSSDGTHTTVVYDREEKGYRVESSEPKDLKNGEALAVCKILLDSHAFPKKQMDRILELIIDMCVSDSGKKLLRDLIRSESFYYAELSHSSDLTDMMWRLGLAIRGSRYIRISYLCMKDEKIVKQKIKPLAMIFSECFFYLAAFTDDEEDGGGFDASGNSCPAVYRLDCIKSLTVTDEKFHVPYSSRFDEGDLRKRVQLMCSDKLQHVTFEYCGTDIDSILDRLPTARILSENEGVYTVNAEVFGKEIDFRLKNQGKLIKIIKQE